MLDLHQMIVLIDMDNLGRVCIGFFLCHLRIAHDDQQVTRLR